MKTCSTSQALHLPLALALAAVGACAGGGTETPEVIDREVFIDAYVDLRVIAVGSEDGVVDDMERSEVLGRHGITEADLLDFAEAHGADAEFMRDVWAEIERRLEEEPLEPPGEAR